jgi:hypothetical protein
VFGVENNVGNHRLFGFRWQMETIASGETPRELSLDYKFRLIPGVTSLEHYGVYIVKKIWPESILREVYDVLDACKKQRSGVFFH